MATFTSRGTVIVKKAIVQESDFPLDEIISAQGQFINILNEIHRYKGSEVNFDFLSNTFIPNVQSQISGLKNAIKNDFLQLLPQTGDYDDPKILDIKIDVRIKTLQTVAPYEEKPIEVLYNDQGKIVE